MGFLSAISRLNAAHPWSHNDAYTPFVLRHARAVRRRGGNTAVDVGCGTGNLLVRLARVFPTAIGIEPDPDMARAAGERFSTRSGARIEQHRFGTKPPHAYDLIVFVASLHHMPLEETLRHARDAVRPDGRVVIVGVARETPGDSVRTWISVLLNPIVGLIRHPARATQTPAHMTAPTAEAEDSFDEIRAIAETILPGIRMRRRLFWRYTAHWTAGG